MFKKGKEEVKSKKPFTRKNFFSLREQIPLSRRKEAKKKAFLFLKKKSILYKNILSFAPKKEEIDIWEFNLFLVKEDKLFLSKVNKENLEIYQVENLENLILNKRYIILEPDDKTCKQEEIEKIDMVIVPALCFDKNKHRLGYGKGHYDRLLFKMRKTTLFLGIGFKEQFSKEQIFTSSLDIALDEVHLF